MLLHNLSILYMTMVKLKCSYWKNMIN